MEQWENPEVRNADFIFFNNSSGWFNNSKALVSKRGAAKKRGSEEHNEGDAGAGCGENKNKQE